VPNFPHVSWVGGKFLDNPLGTQKTLRKGEKKWGQLGGLVFAQPANRDGDFKCDSGNLADISSGSGTKKVCSRRCGHNAKTVKNAL